MADQVELGEASIRISRVMDLLELSDAERMPYKVFDQIHAKISHVPILKAWKALPKKEKRQHLKAIAGVEEEYRDFAKAAAQQMATFEMAAPQAKTSEAASPQFYSA